MVVDANVAVSRLVDEDMSEHARALFRYCELDRRLIAVPLNFPGEVTNALYQKQRSADPQFHLEAPEIDVLLAEFAVLLRSRIVLVARPALYQRAVALARIHRLQAVYDAAYMALAETLDVDLWTNDRRLLNALGPALPWVRWIGDFPLN